MNTAAAPSTHFDRIKTTLEILSSVMVAHCQCDTSADRETRERWTNSYLDGIKALAELEAQTSPFGYLNPAQALVWVAIDTTEGSSMDELRGIATLDDLDDFVSSQVGSAASILNIELPGDANEPAMNAVLDAFREWAINEANDGEGLQHLMGCPHCGRDLEGDEIRAGVCSSDDCPRHDATPEAAYAALTVEPPVAPEPRTQGELDRFSLDLFLQAYAKGKQNGDHIDWDDLDQAYHYACQHSKDAVAEAEARFPAEPEDESYEPSEESLQQAERSQLGFP